MEAVILAVAVIGGVWWWLQRKSQRQRRRRFRPGRGRSPQGQTVPPRLMGELDRLTRDRRVSERLIERIQFNHPGRSRRWCVEKAIYDIQRDRRSS